MPRVLVADDDPVISHLVGTTLRTIRTSTRTSLIPVVIPSGAASDAERAEVEALGVSASLHKPVTPDALMDAIARATDN